MPFDTHSYDKRLVTAGVPEAQAEIHAEVFGEVIIERLATKDDMLSLEHWLRSDIRANLKDLEMRLTLRFGVMLAAAVAIAVALDNLL
jgi:hypothetical protein